MLEIYLYVLYLNKFVFIICFRILISFDGDGLFYVFIYVLIFIKLILIIYRNILDLM